MVTVRPAGRVSVKVIPVSVAAVFGLLIENVSVVVLPVNIGFAVKALLITGGATTVNEDVPYPVGVVLGPVLVDVMFPLMFV